MARSRRLVAAVLTAGALVSTPLAADSGSGGWPKLAPDRGVTAFASSGRTLYLAGDFTRFGRSTGPAVVLDSSTGSVDAAYPRVAGDVVDAIVPDGKGGWFIAGRFSSIGGVACPSLAHIRSNKTVDAAWCPHPDADVTSLALSGRTLYVAGYFDTIGGKTRLLVAALDARTGAVRPWFLSFGTDEEIHPARVTALAVAGSTVYLGGGFASVSGHFDRRLAAIDGTTGKVRDWAPNPDGRVDAILVSGRTIFVGGEFRHIAGQERPGVASFDAASGKLTTWNPHLDGPVEALGVLGRTLYIGGLFSHIGRVRRTGIAAVDVVRGAARRWNPTLYYHSSAGAIAVSGSTVYFAGPFEKVDGIERHELAAVDVHSGKVTPWNPDPDDEPLAITAAGRRVAIGGYFGSVGPPVTRVGLAAIDTASGNMTPWHAELGGPRFDTCRDCRLAAGDSAIYVAGEFSRVDGQPRKGLAALDPVTGDVKPWDPGVDGAIKAIAPAGPVVYVGGDFSHIGGAQRNGLAAIDAATGKATSWNPNPTAEAYFSVSAIAAAGSTIYIAGDFSHIGGAQRNGLAAIDAATGKATAWNPQPDDVVKAIVVVGSTIYAAGNFSRTGAAPRNGLAAIDAATGKVTPWNPAPLYSSEPSGTSVGLIAVAGSTVIVAAGLGSVFDRIGGSPRDGVGAIDAVTGKVKPWLPKLAGDGIVTALLASGSTLYLGGYFDGRLARFPLAEIARAGK